jgi:hypothetical protein
MLLVLRAALAWLGRRLHIIHCDQVARDRMHELPPEHFGLDRW